MPASLDLFSTSQTNENLYAEFALRKRKAVSQKCSYNAPFFAYQIRLAHYGVVQACCNHWDCPRCGVLRAKEEYGRMVQGIELLAQSDPLYMFTVTCRGKELSTDEADKNYGKWTNILLTSFRSRVKRAGGKWCYVSVTERQKRGHPHSHFLTNANPQDLHEETFFNPKRKVNGVISPGMDKRLRSIWLGKAVIKAGLGEQYDFSLIRSAEGASRYAAKYLFKATMFEAGWPKGWKRIRYSNNFPKLPEVTTDAFPLIDFHDWHLLARRAAFVSVSDPLVLADVRNRLSHGCTIVDLKK